jgi:hypothetical protein
MKSYNYPEIDHPINFVVRDHEIVFSLPNGKEIASLQVCTMEKDVKNDSGKYETKPSKSFWLQFFPKDSSTGKNVAAVFID